MQTRANRSWELLELQLARVENNQKSNALQLQDREEAVARAEAVVADRERDVEALTIRATCDGILQELGPSLSNRWEVGERVAAGARVAMITNPQNLKAVLEVSDMQAQEVMIDQTVTIDTRTAEIPGRVIRVDSAVQDGRVAVDVELLGELPPGARPDLQVNGKILIEQLNDALQLSPFPAFSDANSTITLFRVTADGTQAVQTTVELGRGSLNTVEIVVNGVLLAPLPYEAPDRLAVLSSVNRERGEQRDYVSIPDFLDWREHAESIEECAVYQWAHLDLRTESGSQRIQGLAASPGFFQVMRRRNLLTMSLSLPEAQYEWRRNTDFCHEVLDAVRLLPGVTHAAAIRGVPTQDTRFETYVLIEGRPELPIDQRPLVTIRVISRGYFETMGIPLLAGRTFEPADEEGEIGNAHAIIISRTMADRLWPGESALGKRVRLAEDLPFSEVIGVVDSVRYDSLDVEPVPEVYYPDALFPQTTMNLIVRSPLDPGDLTRSVRTQVLHVEPDALITDVQTMEQVLRGSVAERRFAAVILTAFSISAFVLAVVGIFGVMAFSVGQRRQELGIRLALGARPGQILWNVLCRSLALSGTGIAAGLVLSWAGSRLLSAFLYGIEPTDPATYVTACLLLLAASTAACYVPARRAAATEPMSVLRNE